MFFYLCEVFSQPCTIPGLSLCDFSEHRDPSLSAKYEKQLSFTAEHMMAFSESLSYLSALDWYAQSQEPAEFTHGVP